MIFKFNFNMKYDNPLQFWFLNIQFCYQYYIWLVKPQIPMI